MRAAFADPDPGATAKAAVTDLENGATSLWLQVGPTGLPHEDLATALDEVLLDLAPVVLETDGDAVPAAEAFVAVIAERGVTPAEGTNLGADPIGAAVRRGRVPEDVEQVVTRVAELAREAGTLASSSTPPPCTTSAPPTPRSSATAWPSARRTSGSSTGRRGRRRRGRAAARVPLRRHRRAVPDHRQAARRPPALGTGARAQRGAPPRRAGQRQHAVTSRPMMSKYDPWVNMLRTTRRGVRRRRRRRRRGHRAAVRRPARAARRVRPPDRPQHLARC